MTGADRTSGDGPPDDRMTGCAGRRYLLERDEWPDCERAGPMKRVVLLHAHQDTEYCAELRKHLVVLEHRGEIDLWHPGRATPGQNGADVDEQHLSASSMLVILVSSDYLSECHAQMLRALSIARQRDVPLVPILLRPCPWRHSELGSLQPLPASNRYVITEPNRDAAWEGVVDGMVEVLSRATPPGAPPTELAASKLDAPSRAIVLVSPRRSGLPPEGIENTSYSIHAAYRLLAVCDDSTIAASAVEHLVRTPALTAEDEALLRERFDDLPDELAFELAERHGHLGCAVKLVDRLVAALQSERPEQIPYTHPIYIYHPETLSVLLGQEAYAKYVSRLLPHRGDAGQQVLLAFVRGGRLFNALVDAERGQGGVYAGELARLLFDVRDDEDGCRRVLEARMSRASISELLWLHKVTSRAGSRDLSESARHRIVERFGELEEQDDGRQGPTPAHWRFVRDWAAAEGPDRPQRIAWLADRVMDMEQRGFSFFGFHRSEYTFPEALRIDVAGALVDRGHLPEWVGDVLLQRLSCRREKAWRPVFQWWRPWEETRWGGDHATRKAILMKAPLPEDASDDFDEAYLRCARDEMAYEDDWLTEAGRIFKEQSRGGSREHFADMTHAEIERSIRSPVWDRYVGSMRPFLTMAAVLERLLEMKLTARRATRIARGLKDAPELLPHERIREVAELAAPLGAEELPPLGALKLHDPVQVDIYRRLGGRAADEQLRAHLRDEIVHPGPRYSRSLDGMCERWPWIEHVAGDALLGSLRASARDLPVATLARLSRRAPWLVDKAMLHSAAAAQLDDRWQWEAEELPPSLLPFVEERARRAATSDELVSLLAWLDENGISRSVRLELLLVPRKRGWGWDEWARIIAPMLLHLAEWEEDGPRVVRAMTEQKAWFHLSSLWTCLRAAWPSGDDFSALTRVAHVAFAAALTDLAESAARRGDEAHLLAMIDAISRLHHGRTVAERLAVLSRAHELSDEVKRRIDREIQSLEVADSRAPPFEALFHATDVAFAHDYNAPRE